MSITVSSAQSSAETAGYDWRLEENCTKWRGLFVPALQKVLTQVHPTLVAKEDALEYVEGLILRLLEMLTAKPTPVSVQDVEDRITRTFPTPIDKWALSEAQSAVEKGRKKSCLVLPVEKVHPILSKEVLQNRVDDQVRHCSSSLTEPDCSMSHCRSHCTLWLCWSTYPQIYSNWPGTMSNTSDTSRSPVKT